MLSLVVEVPSLVVDVPSLVVDTAEDSEVVSPLLELRVNEVALEVELAETPPQEARLASKTLERRNNAGFFMMNKSFRSPYKVGEG